MSEQNRVLPEPIPYGNYYLLERVNSGGMAEVFKAKAFGIEGFERLVAVKKILSSIAEDTEFIKMFIDEAKLSGQLQHANVAHIFDLGRVNDSYYIALEYVAGKDLRLIWERSREMRQLLPVDMVCYVISKVCDGLEYAHNKTDAAGQPLNIVHRDVSPQNILVSYEGDVKLIDFGVAKAASSSTETRVGILKGKLSYMSPEQVRGLVLDRRSDTFAVGVVLYEMLTGERLFLGDSDFETLEKIRKVEIAPPTLFNPSIPKELEEIVLYALQKSPNQRYQSAHELQAALQRFMFDRGLYFTSRELASVMADVFPAEIAEEHEKNIKFLSLSLSDLKSEISEQLGWDDDENETQVFTQKTPNRHDPLAALDDFVPPTEDVVWKKKPTSKRRSSTPARSTIPEPAFRSTTPEHNPQKTKPRSTQKNSEDTLVPFRHEQKINKEEKKNKALFVSFFVIVFGVVITALFLLKQSPETATLHINAFDEGSGEAIVMLDNESVYQGELPTDIEMEEGEHELQISMDGFEIMSVRVNAETNIITPDLEPENESVSFIVTSLPIGAEVFVDEESVGITPYRLEGLLGENHLLRVIGEEGIVLHEDYVTLAENMDLMLLMPRVEVVPIMTTIGSTPSGAAFEIHNAAGEVLISGVTPNTANLSPNLAYTVHFTLEDHESSSVPFTPTSESSVLNAELSALEEESEERTVEPPERESEQENEREAERRAERRAEREAEREREREEAQRERERERQRQAQQNQDAEPGSLNVQSRPAARVYIDGDDTGRYTPLIGVELPAGSHRIRLVNEEFGFDRSYRVRIQPGRTRTLIGAPE